MGKSIFERWAKDDKDQPFTKNLFFMLNGEEKEFQLIHNFQVLQLDIYKALGNGQSLPKILLYVIFVLCYLSKTSEYKLICITKDDWEKFS
jgi:hypothetical protein